MEMIHKRHSIFLEPLNRYTFSCISTSHKYGITRTGFASGVSYCCDIHRAKEMTCILHGARVQRHFVRCLVSLNYIQDLTENCSIKYSY